MSLLARLEREPFPLLRKRAAVLIERLPEGPRKERFRAELKALDMLPPEEQFRRVVLLLIVLFLLAGVAMAFGYFLVRV